MIPIHVNRFSRQVIALYGWLSLHLYTFSAVLPLFHIFSPPLLLLLLLLLILLLFYISLSECTSTSTCLCCVLCVVCVWHRTDNWQHSLSVHCIFRVLPLFKLRSFLLHFRVRFLIVLLIVYILVHHKQQNETETQWHQKMKKMKKKEQTNKQKKRLNGTVQDIQKTFMELSNFFLFLSSSLRPPPYYAIACQLFSPTLCFL